MRFLVITDAIPRPDFDSGYRRLAEVLKHLAPHHRITLIARHIYEEPEIRRVAADRLRGLGVSEIWEGEWTLAKVLRERRFDTAYFHYYHTADWAMDAFRTAQPEAKVLVDSGDLHYIREESAVAVGTVSPAHAEAVKKAEFRVYRGADVVITNSDEDDLIFRREFPEVPSRMVANIVPLRGRPESHRDDRLFFVGNFNHKPNVDGILWFAREILPLVLQEKPSAVLEIGGKNPPAELNDFPAAGAIQALGWIPDTNVHLDSARIAVAPLRFGGGMKGKVSESLASAVPTVTTTFGAQGFGAEDRVHLRIADDAEGFAQAIIGLLNNETEAERMGHAGQELVRSRYSPEAVLKNVDECVSLLEARPTRAIAKSFSRMRFFLGSHMLACSQRLAAAGSRMSGLH